MLPRFNSRTPGGVRPSLSLSPSTLCLFQFTHPGRGATIILYICGVQMICFNSRTPGGVRHRFNPFRLLAYQFQFTHPGRGATTLRCVKQVTMPMFQFTHPGRGATEGLTCDTSVATFQFTHPGRGATGACGRLTASTRGFNSRTPGGVRPPWNRRSNHSREFQFTHPGRGATYLCQLRVHRLLKFQFTHPGRGATSNSSFILSTERVSIHAPREGCDGR